jgi:gamma-glutamyltranspeptidase/glutathione hydrolase
VGAAGQPILIAGAAGGPTIITTTLDAIRAVVDFGEDAGAALAAPRMHMQWLPDTVYAQSATFDAATLAQLTAAGYTVKIRPSWSIANAISIRPDGTRVAAHDPDTPTGSALAY